MESIKKTIPGLITLALLSVFLGVILPGILLYYNNIFFKKDVIERLDKSVRTIYLNNEVEKQKIESRQIQILNKLSDTSESLSFTEINNGYLALKNLEKLKQESNKITISPYYPKNKTLLLWVLLYFGFSSLIFLNKDICNTVVSKSYYLLIFSLLYIFWRWAAWFRNTPLGEIDRVVYSVNNIDISKFGFFLQEILSLLSLLMLAYILCKWIEHSEILREKYYKQKNLDLNTLFKVTIDLRTKYQEWQLSSIFLTIAFGYYTYYFWEVINRTLDMRFLPQAIIIHFIWGLSWYIISLPLIITNGFHIHLKDQFTDPSKKNLIPVEDTEKFSHIYNMDPISSQNKFITTALGSLTFLFPILEPFI